MFQKMLLEQPRTAEIGTSTVMHSETMVGLDKISPPVGWPLAVDCCKQQQNGHLRNLIELIEEKSYPN